MILFAATLLLWYPTLWYLTIASVPEGRKQMVGPDGSDAMLPMYVLPAVTFVWPLAVSVLLRLLRWPQLLRPAALAYFAVAFWGFFLFFAAGVGMFIAKAIALGDWASLSLLPFRVILWAMNALVPCAWDLGRLCVITYLLTMYFAQSYGRAALVGLRRYHELQIGNEPQSPVVRVVFGWLSSLISVLLCLFVVLQAIGLLLFSEDYQDPFFNL